MKLTRRFATISAAATATLLLSAGGAQAEGDGGLLSLLGNSPLIQVCYPMGQVGGIGNSNTGAQSCAQNSEATTPADGAGGVTGREIVTGVAQVMPGQQGFAVAFCPDGKVSVGGGIDTSQNTNWQNEKTFATGPGSWGAIAVNTGGETGSITAQAVCVDSAD
ncbi:hypothetical protein ABT237_25260 [Streptomyces sp. NPDC001581]|uniref:hypothetical protein n=1 Tax=Streptomyces sp. NPDC001581 TaxID=3154386 RepID=UPI00331CB9F0